MKHPIPRAALDDRLGFLGTSGSGKTYNAGTAVEILLHQKARVVILDPLGVWWGLRLRADGKTPSGFNVAIFGGPHGDLPLTEHAGALIGETAASMAESCIIDLSELKSKSAERRFMVAFLEAIYRKAGGEPFHLVVDEADLFAPQKPSSGDEVLLGHMENIVRRGRIKGFIPWLISQRPAVLNKNVLSQVDGLLAFKLTSTQDRDALDAWIEGQADKAKGKEIKDSLPTLQIGQGVVWIPGRGILDAPAAFPEKVTFDSSRTPKRGQKLKYRTLKTLDMSSLKDRLAAVEADAKANDPKALRADIAKLKSEKDLLVKQIAGFDSKAAKAKPDKDALAAAEKKGFEQAKRKLGATAETELRKRIVAVHSDLRERLIELVRYMDIELATARKARPDLKGEVVYTPSAPAAPTPPAGRISAEVSRLARPAVASRPQRAVPVATGDGNYTRPQMRVLEALAMWRALGHEAPSREMVAAVAGYSPSSGGFNNLLGTLNTSGAITYPQPGDVTLLADGVAVISKDDGRDLLLSRLSNPQKKILGALIDQQVRSRDDVAVDTQYSASSGGFNNLLGSLRSLGLIVYPRAGLVGLAGWSQELLSGYAERLAA